MRTFDDLSKDDKQKFLVMNLWYINNLIYFTWFFIILGVLMGVAFIGGIIQADMIFQGYILLAAGAFTLLFIFRVKRIEKRMRLIFGCSKNIYQHFFGIEDKDIKVTFRELLRDIEKVQMKRE